ncbi:unnamed protein product, partial [Brenthis ino]
MSLAYPLHGGGKARVVRCEVTRAPPAAALARRAYRAPRDVLSVTYPWSTNTSQSSLSGPRHLRHSCCHLRHLLRFQHCRNYSMDTPRMRTDGTSTTSGDSMSL